MKQLPYDDSKKPAKRLLKPGIVRNLALCIVGIGLLAYGGMGIWQKHKATNAPQAISDNKTITTSSDTPDETPVDTNERYEVPANQPRRIQLPTIEAEGFIQKVGIDKSGAIATPNNIHLAGWYANEAIPGKPGLGIIDGHVQGKYNPGIFKNLGQLKPGDTFSVQFGDMSDKQFEVVSVKTYSIDSVSKHLFYKNPTIHSQLNVITCGGKYNQTNKQYDQRVLVVSKLIE